MNDILTTHRKHVPCSICNSKYKSTVCKNRIKIPNTDAMVLLQTSEFRCTDHYYYAPCSYCKVNINIHEAHLNKQYGYFGILCGKHSSTSRCLVCRKWIPVPGDIPSERMCKCLVISLVDHNRISGNKTNNSINKSKLFSPKYINRKISESLYVEFMRLKGRESYQMAKLMELYMFD